MYIRFLDGQLKTSAGPTGIYCTNYRAEVEALVLASQLISSTVEQEAQVVFLTDALSVLEAASNSKLPRLEDALKSIKCTKVVLQWIPSHCGILGNEEADKLAKHGAYKEQKDNGVSLPEMKTIFKSLFRPRSARDNYHQLTRPQQVIIFRLRTGHNRRNHHVQTLPPCTFSFLPMWTS